MSIYENVAFGLRLQQRLPKRKRDDIIEWALTSAALWDEVKDRLHRSAWQLSGYRSYRVTHGAMAQLVAHLLCKQRVRGSSPLSSTKDEKFEACPA